MSFGQPEQRSLIPGSCLVSCFPQSSGHGRAVASLQDLGLYRDTALFKIRRHDSEKGYRIVVRDHLRLGTPAAFLSLYLPSRWSRFVSQYDFVHYSSPHFFHLARYNPNATGTVHDLIFLEKSTHNPHDTPFGAGFFFPRVMKYAEELKGVVTISHVVDRQLRARFPRTNSRVIHHWTSNEFMPREKLAARRQLGLPTNRKILLNVSIDVVRKNIDILPKIVNALDDSFLLVRIGESDRIASQFKSDRLVWIASVSPLAYPLYFNAADVVLMPSRAEGFGFPIIEGLNSMTPVVASNIEIFREILGESYPFLVGPDDLEGWLTATQAAWEVAQSQSASRGIYGKFRDYYRPERGLRELLTFYHDLGVLSPATHPVSLASSSASRSQTHA
jgi:glycosyltransferase involved in cell wall biosynthesis